MDKADICITLMLLWHLQSDGFHEGRKTVMCLEFFECDILQPLLQQPFRLSFILSVLKLFFIWFIMYVNMWNNNEWK